MRPVIHSIKHIVQQSRSTVATVSIANIDIALSVEPSAVSDVDEVIEGSVIKAVFVELWLLDQANDGSFVVTLEKRQGVCPIYTLHYL